MAATVRIEITGLDELRRLVERMERAAVAMGEAADSLKLEPIIEPLKLEHCDDFFRRCKETIDAQTMRSLLIPQSTTGEWAKIAHMGVDIASAPDQSVTMHWKPCPDCEGKGKYSGLNTIEDCRACEGTGRIVLTGSEE